MSDSTKKTMRNLGRAGFGVSVTRGGHLKITRPDTTGFVIAPATAGSRFQGKQTRALLRCVMRRDGRLRETHG